MIANVQARWLRDAARAATTERLAYRDAVARYVSARRAKTEAGARADIAARDAAWAWAWVDMAGYGRAMATIAAEADAIEATITASAEAVRQANRVFRARALRDDIAEAMQMRSTP